MTTKHLSLFSAVFLFFLFSVGFAQAQSELAAGIRNIGNLSEEQAQRLEAFYQNRVSEKLYLMTDKPYYSAGENIWFKGFLVNAATLQADTPTNYIYVVLVDQRDSILHRVKIKCDEYGFHNCMALDPATPPGNYTLRGYTQWMRNEDEAFFFTKTIPVGNLIDDAVNTSITYSREEDGTLLALLTLRDMNRHPIAQQQLDYKLDLDGKTRRSRARTDDNGQLRIRFQPPADDLQKNALHLTVSDEGLFFERSFFLPSFSDGFDIQFFPESGRLLPLGAQEVAFKAVGANGLGVDVTGTIYTADGNPVASFASVHRGMGRFGLIPTAGQTYYAEVVSLEGKTLRAELPATAASGATLKVAREDDKLLCQLALTPDRDLSHLFFVIQSRGEVLFAEKINDRTTLKRILASTLPEGISQWALLDTLRKETLAERLVFVPDERPAVCEVSPQADNHVRRGKVTVEITAKGFDGKPLQGDFALAVTDRHQIRQDTLAGHIRSGLLLTSDLKGYVEEPGYYFLDDSPQRAYHLDLLMMTQGWRRHTLADLFDERFSAPVYPVEWSQSLCGKIGGLLGKGVKKASLIVTSFTDDFAAHYDLPETKAFVIDGLSFADSTILFLQATNEKKWARGITLDIDSAVFPTAHTFTPSPHFTRISSPIPDQFLDMMKQKYYEEGGMRVFNIDAVQVTVRKKEMERREAQNFHGITVNRLMMEDEFKAYQGQPLITALFKLGISLNADTVTYIPFLCDRQGRKIPLMILNGMPIDISNNLIQFEIIRTREVKRVGYIPYYSPTLSSFGFRAQSGSGEGGGGGIILIETKTGAELAGADIANTAQVIISPFGYKKPEVFYQPKYDVPEELKNTKPDLRTTLCWEPRLRTDEHGKAQVWFYTADADTQYDLILEGISDDGQICRATATMNRTQ